MALSGPPSSGIPPLLGLHAYEASARHLSFVAAAKELHLSPSAVSQRVRTLEAHLGVALFERRPRSLRLTDAGESYLPVVRDVFQSLAAGTGGLFGMPARVDLTVRVQVSYAVTWLAPRLPDFMAAYPEVRLRLVSAIWADTLSPSDVDVEIRQGNGSWPGYRAVKLHDDRAVAVHGDRFLGAYGSAPDRGSLRERPRVQVLGFDDLWRHVFDDTGADATAPPAAVTVDTSLAAMELVTTSSHWAILPERFTRAAVADGRLHVVGDPVPMRQAHYLLRPDDRRPLSPPALAFTGWLRAQDEAPAAG